VISASPGRRIGPALPGPSHGQMTDQARDPPAAGSPWRGYWLRGWLSDPGRVPASAHLSAASNERTWYEVGAETRQARGVESSQAVDKPEPIDPGRYQTGALWGSTRAGRRRYMQSYSSERLCPPHRQGLSAC